jgi:hypothetical protein
MDAKALALGSGRGWRHELFYARRNKCHILRCGNTLPDHAHGVTYSIAFIVDSIRYK